MRKLIKHTLTGLAIGAKTLAPGGDALAQVNAPAVNIEVDADFKVTHLKFGRFGSMYSKITMAAMPLRSEIMDDFLGKVHTPVTELFLGTGLDINLGRKTKLDIGIAFSRKASGRANLTLKHNLERFGMPNINAYVNYTSSDWSAEYPGGSQTGVYREGFGLGMEYEKEFKKNLKFYAKMGVCHNRVGTEDYHLSGSPFAFHGAVGLHYKIPPLKRPDFDTEPPPPRPKRQKVKKSNSRRVQQVSCPAHQLKPHEKPTTIFNKP